MNNDKNHKLPDRKKAMFILVVCSLLWMINFADRQVLFIVLQPMKINLGFSDAISGWISTAIFISMAIFAMPVAYLADKWSRTKSIGIMAIFWSVCTFFIGTGNDFISVFVLRLLSGIGIAGFSSAAMALITTSYPEDVRARKMGIFNLFQFIGIGIGLIGGGFISARLGGWRMPFFIFAFPGIIFGILAFFMKDYDNDTKNSYQKKTSLLNNIKSLISIPTLTWFYAGYIMFNIMTFAILTWIPALLMRKYNVGEDIAGTVMAITGALSIPGVLLGGIISDKWQKKNNAGRMKFASLMGLLSPAGIISAILCIFIFHDINNGFLSFYMIAGIVMFIIFCATSAAVNPAVMAVTQSVVSKDLKGLAWGLCVFLIMVMGGAWSPTLAGYLSDFFNGGTRGLAFSLVIISSIGFGSFICWMMSSKYYHQDAEKVKFNNN